MRTIIINKGIPASGKTTESKRMMRENPGKYKRVNKDDLRAMIDNGHWTRKLENFTISVRDAIVEKALIQGYDVIVDDTNFAEKHYKAICSIAKRIGDVRVIERFFEVPLKEALKRNAARENPVPEEAIYHMYNKHVKNKKMEIRDVYFEPNIKKILTSKDLDSTKLPAVIFDVDGTLAHNYGGRSPFDGTRVLEDTPDMDVIELAKMFKEKGYVVLVVSGREDLCQEDTETWLKVNEVPYDAIFMRKSKDYRKDFVIKREIYEEHIGPYYNVFYVVDDRPQVCRVWREMGLMVLQVNDLDF